MFLPETFNVLITILIRLRKAVYKLVVFSTCQIFDYLFYLFRLNPLSLVEICIPIVGRLTQADPEESLQFLEKIGEKVKANTEAFVMAKILIGRIHLLNNDLLKTKVS